MIYDLLKAAGLILAAIMLLVSDMLGWIGIDAVVPIPGELSAGVNRASALMCLFAVLSIVIVSTRPTRKSRPRTALLGLMIAVPGAVMISGYYYFFGSNIVASNDEHCPEPGYFYVPFPVPPAAALEIRDSHIENLDASDKGTVARILCDPNSAERMQALLSPARGNGPGILTAYLALAKALIFSGIFLLLWTVTSLDVQRRRRSSASAPPSGQPL